jgi:hypothetical protein
MLWQVGLCYLQQLRSGEDVEEIHGTDSGNLPADAISMLL